jgi:hypothetical protein
MFDVAFIVLGKVVFDIHREIEGGPLGLRKEGEGGGDSRLLPPFQAKGLPQELLSKPGVSLLCSEAFVT